MVQPRALIGIQKVRIGNEYDGGYVLPSLALKADVVVSIGVAYDVSFDFALAQLGAQILQFDPTLDEPPSQHPNFNFHRLGLGTISAGEFLSFADIHSKAIACNPKHALLKIDIEGGEYEALLATDGELLKAYEVIACEFHDLQKLEDPVFFQLVWQTFSKLTLTHTSVHLHGNNYGGMSLVLGVPVPCVIEVSFLRRDLGEFNASAVEPIPGPLDRANNPTIPDLFLTPFIFSSS
jgi:hypothetical protein